MAERERHQRSSREATEKPQKSSKKCLNVYSSLWFLMMSRRYSATFAVVHIHVSWVGVPGIRGGTGFSIGSIGVESIGVDRPGLGWDSRWRLRTMKTFSRSLQPVSRRSAGPSSARPFPPRDSRFHLPFRSRVVDDRLLMTGLTVFFSAAIGRNMSRFPVCVSAVLDNVNRLLLTTYLVDHTTSKVPPSHHIRLFNTTAPHYVNSDTPPVQQLIRDAVEILRPQIEEFLTQDRLVSWMPRGRVSETTKQFYRDLAIPSIRGNPTLLLHRLGERSNPLVDEVFGAPIHR
jgi:hypothetical protein